MEQHEQLSNWVLSFRVSVDVASDPNDREDEDETGEVLRNNRVAEHILVVILWSCFCLQDGVVDERRVENKVDYDVGPKDALSFSFEELARYFSLTEKHWYSHCKPKILGSKKPMGDWTKETCYTSVWVDKFLPLLTTVMGISSVGFKFSSSHCFQEVCA